VHLTFGQTERLIKVAGTKCSLIPPDNFEPATNFSGFWQVESGASIMINELPTAYQPLVDEFTAGALLLKGMTLLEKQTVDFNNLKATFIKVKQMANGTQYLKQILIFGDTKQTILVNGIYPETNKVIEHEIKNALLSTVFNSDQADNPLDAATFTVDISNTDFKLIKYMSGSLLFSTDGKMPTRQPTLIVSNSVAKVTAQNQKQYTLERLKKLPGGEFSDIKEIQEITIDNMKGYEIVAHGKTKDDKPTLVYQVMIFNDKGYYYLIVGQAREDQLRNLENFRLIAKTFKRK